MNSLINILTKSGLLTKDLDYHLIRASMVIIFLFFGYQKWFEYEAQVLIPYIRNSWGARLMCYIHNDRHYYSIYAKWLGCVCRRVSSNGGQRSFPHEGCGSLCCISLFAKAGCTEGLTFRPK
jgi:hypothetical protein